jgi:two-component system, cell cycle response regulator
MNNQTESQPENETKQDPSFVSKSQEAAINSTGKSGYRALIVDDHVVSQKLLALSLSLQPEIGEIDCVESGKDAIEKVKTQHYDIILMDAVMPEMDGYEACYRLRKNPDYKNTPIIMVTGLTSPLDEARAIIVGSTSYITKPVQQKHFKEVVAREISLIEYKKNLKYSTT